MEDKCTCDYEERRCGWCKSLESRLAAEITLADDAIAEAKRQCDLNHTNEKRIAELEQSLAAAKNEVDRLGKLLLEAITVSLKEKAELEQENQRLREAAGIIESLRAGADCSVTDGS